MNVGENITYGSVNTANGILSSIARVINSVINKKLNCSPVISVLADESCDIGMQKKVIVFVGILNPETFEPYTVLLKNVKVQDGTGATISKAILDCLEERQVPMSKVYGFGSDGAKAMVGKNQGVT